MTDPRDLLTSWFPAAEQWWYDIPGKPDQGCLGTGYNSWGVQTNQKYLSAMAVLGTEASLARALAAFRFSMASHVSGDGACTDGTQWGHTWISALGVERMMHAMPHLEKVFTDGDRAALRRMLLSESDWLLNDYSGPASGGVRAGLWAHEGKNVPESNLWNGAILWRAAAMYPDAPEADALRERAHEFLINSVCVAADADDETIVAGKPVRERHVGANFHDGYALDHHGYMNVGYMVICLSNAAMLHFDLKAAGLERPESLDHHEEDLWRVVRRMIFADGRLCRIGGDTRIRYAYCQEYLLPALLYAADRFGDDGALDLAERQLEMIAAEAKANGDGTFYGRRLADMNPYYRTRLETDRACALGQYLVYLPLLPSGEKMSAQRTDEGASGSSVPAAAGGTAPSETPSSGPSGHLLPGGEKGGRPFATDGGWIDFAHGAVLHRGPKRIASVAWRANNGPAALCTPPDDGHLVEWERNGEGRIEVHCSPYAGRARSDRPRRLVDGRVESVPGGFLAFGTVFEGAEIEITEGWRGVDSIRHALVYAALPDDRTVVGLQFARATDRRVLIERSAGLGWNVPNDLFNGDRRMLTTAAGDIELISSPDEEQSIDLGRWVCVDGRVGLVSLYGGELSVHRWPERRAGLYRSLHVEEIVQADRRERRWLEPGEIVLDCAWAALSGADASATAAWAEANAPAAPEPDVPQRSLTVRLPDGRSFEIEVDLTGATCAATLREA